MPSLRKRKEKETDAEISEEKPETITDLTAPLLYGIETPPPWYLCILLGFQHYLTMFGSTVAIPLIITPALCIGDDQVAKSEIISTIFFVSGIVTILQTMFGCRLPIVQGGTFALIPPAFALLSLPQWQCPDLTAAANITNTTNSTNQTGVDSTEIWQSRMRELQGCIMVASLVQIVIGFTGVLGILMSFIGPLCITPTVILIGLALFEAANLFSSKLWWIAMLTMALIAIFSQYIPRFKFCQRNKCLAVVAKGVSLFPIILGIGVSWAVCYILTVTEALPKEEDGWGYYARTDIRADVLKDAPWFRFPYPGQWGMPTASVAGVLGMIAGLFASIVESVGDYYACARLSGAPPPPTHAINRGIGIEGIGSILAGAWGTCSGTTSYSENVGAIGITRVGSRRVVQFGAIIMILLGMLGKFGALFVTIPDPVVGGVFFTMFGLITAVGMSNLQHVDLNSSRNLYVIGSALFTGFSLPQWLKANPGVIQTGNETADNIITVLMTTNMFVGGVVGFFLDNTIPGTAEERGLVSWQKQVVTDDADPSSRLKAGLECYDFPFGMNLVRKFGCNKYNPTCPTFDLKYCCTCKQRTEDSTGTERVDINGSQFGYMSGSAQENQGYANPSANTHL